MKIRVAGMDPSMTHWGIAVADLDLTTGFLDTPVLDVIEPDKLEGKQVRVNSTDIHKAEQLAQAAFTTAGTVRAVFVEVPVGSQSARAMCAYGVCCGILGAMRSQRIEFIQVTATEVKKALTGKLGASKDQMVAAAVELYPQANWPRQERNGAKFKKGDLMASAEHAADAIGAIHAGVNTPAFRQLLQMFQTREEYPHADHPHAARDRTGAAGLRLLDHHRA